MKIVVGSIESKLNESFFADFKLIAIDTISKYIMVIKKLKASGVKRNLYSFEENDAEKFIRSHYYEIVKSINNDDVIQVFDAIRHSFGCYAYNGLHQLYTRQENEDWHPTVKLTEILTPNDINSLDDTLELYRGCDISEFENMNFGQAWTTSLDIAKSFAYDHYSNKIWFDKNKRVILKTTYSREYVLYSDQTIEHEVVIDTSKLDTVLRVYPDRD
ncbi:hypothetical protein ABN154_18385 [Klebsiella michiganensis]|uniref:hypothetical protein n=1 Tax=Klebsiella michiganensis TaxID=1134687 RepID=UPI0032DBC432